MTAKDNFTIAMEEAEVFLRSGKIDAALLRLEDAKKEYRKLKSELWEARIALGQKEEP